ncbi:GNAT family N-acetyltransferase [uncultured Erythrobacter sp.]|uniref:GNAT family N-acetyltransferase n=1 Tax=uncultured Erythrobacter sp. TaxID=263913 RepID=UPI0026303746|nr:GNAT family N-acetyltransferase [uncultured Erythrobacter sp.]
MGDIVLETERLILRTVVESDAALQHRVLNTPIVMEHLGGVKELHEIEAKHAKVMQLHAREGYSFLMLIEKATGDLVGHSGIKQVDNPNAPNQGDHEIGWLIREDRWRRGYAHEAMVTVLKWAFGPENKKGVDAQHVVAITNPPNIGSWKLMEKLGMERREDLDFVDGEPLIQYSLTKAKWESAQ